MINGRSIDRIRARITDEGAWSAVTAAIRLKRIDEFALCICKHRRFIDRQNAELPTAPLLMLDASGRQFASDQLTPGRQMLNSIENAGQILRTNVQMQKRDVRHVRVVKRKPVGFVAQQLSIQL